MPPGKGRAAEPPTTGVRTRAQTRRKSQPKGDPSSVPSTPKQPKPASGSHDTPKARTVPSKAYQRSSPEPCDGPPSAGGVETIERSSGLRGGGSARQRAPTAPTTPHSRHNEPKVQQGTVASAKKSLSRASASTLPKSYTGDAALEHGKVASAKRSLSSAFAESAQQGNRQNRISQVVLYHPMLKGNIDHYSYSGIDTPDYLPSVNGAQWMQLQDLLHDIRRGRSHGVDEELLNRCKEGSKLRERLECLQREYPPDTFNVLVFMIARKLMDGSGRWAMPCINTTLVEDKDQTLYVCNELRRSYAMECDLGDMLFRFVEHLGTVTMNTFDFKVRRPLGTPLSRENPVAAPRETLATRAVIHSYAPPDILSGESSPYIKWMDDGSNGSDWVPLSTLMQGVSSGMVNEPKKPLKRLIPASDMHTTFVMPMLEQLRDIDWLGRRQSYPDQCQPSVLLVRRDDGFWCLPGGLYPPPNMENMHQATNPLIAAQVKWTISQTGLNLSIADWTHIGHVTNDVVAPGLPN